MIFYFDPSATTAVYHLYAWHYVKVCEKTSCIIIYVSYPKSKIILYYLDILFLQLKLIK